MLIRVLYKAQRCWREEKKTKLNEKFEFIFMYKWEEKRKEMCNKNNFHCENR